MKEIKERQRILNDLAEAFLRDLSISIVSLLLTVKVLMTRIFFCIFWLTAVFKIRNNRP